MEDVCFHIWDSVDCEQSEWKVLDPCSKNCGGGEMTEFRKLIKKAENGGKACGPGSRKTPCNTDACPGKKNLQYDLNRTPTRNFSYFILNFVMLSKSIKSWFECIFYIRKRYQSVRCSYFCHIVLPNLALTKSALYTKIDRYRRLCLRWSSQIQRRCESITRRFW